MWLQVLFAQAKEPPDRLQIVIGLGLLAGVLLLGAVAITAVDRWRKRMTAASGEDAGELSSYRAMYESGEITEAEYAELRRRLAEKVKQPAVPAPPAANGQPNPALFGLVPPAPAPEASPKLDPPAPKESPPPP
jgi:Short C-terminal domain